MTTAEKMSGIDNRVNERVLVIQSTMTESVNEYVPRLCTAWECGVAKGKFDKFGTNLPEGFRNASSFDFDGQQAFDAGYTSAMFDRA